MNDIKRHERSRKRCFASFYIATAFVFCLSALNLSTVSAAVVVNVQNATLNAAGTGFLDVLIDITGTDDLESASYDFRITNVGSPVSTLEFTGLTGGGEANYVFAGDSVGQGLDLPLTPSQLVGSDSIDIGPAVSGSGLLLARLNLQSVVGIGGPAAAIGDQFRITLEDSGDTLFINGAGLDINLDAGTFNPLVGGGLVTITAVPEPSCLTGLGLLTVLAFYRRPRRLLPQSS